MNKETLQQIAENMEKSIKSSDSDDKKITAPRKRSKRQEIYSCEICNGEEVIFTGERSTKLCKCVPIRNSLMSIYYSEAGEKFRECTLENYVASEEWRKKLKADCIDYLENSGDKWLYIGGQIGCGKSHLCTAVFIELLKKGFNCVKMNWKTDSSILKASVNDITYDTKIDKYKKAEVLFIDDFLKTNKATAPTQADTQLAYEIIEHRYNKMLKTIISSEKFTSEIIEFDEAVGSRIVELSAPYILNVARDTKRNYRLKDVNTDI